MLRLGVLRLPMSVILLLAKKEFLAAGFKVLGKLRFLFDFLIGDSKCRAGAKMGKAQSFMGKTAVTNLALERGIEGGIKALGTYDWEILTRR